MRVKRYVVETMPEAMQKIRNELGNDAVILNTKEVRSGGFLGLFGKRQIEVIAATDTAAPNEYAATLLPNAAFKSTSTKHRAVAQTAAAARSSSQLSVGVLEEPRVNSEKGKFRDEQLIQEIQKMKDMLHQLSRKENLQQYPVVFQSIEQRLLTQEVDPIIVQQLLQGAMADAGQLIEQLTAEQALGLVKSQLKQILRSKIEKKLGEEARIAHFVGPTGVGKTTTIAKLAAEQVLKFNKKVGFITSDTYRIAAVEQLKTYGMILNVPLEVVFSPLELDRAFQNLQQCDIIFMDTAGRNYRNEMYVSELNSLLQSNGTSETYLVLSLTSKYKDMRMIAENFSKFKLDKLLFTKMDETDTYGDIVNLSHHLSIPLSYITNGQNVPNDIAVFNEDSIIDLLLEEKTYG